MLEWLPAPIDEREATLRAASSKVWPVMKLVAGPWTISKWNLSDPRYALWRGAERWPKEYGFKSAKEAMDLAESMERHGQ